MKTSCLILLFLLTGFTASSTAQQSYREIHKKAIVIDLHTDVILRHMRGQTIEKRSNRGQVDLIRLKEGGVDAQFFALWPNPYKNPADLMYEDTKNLLDSMLAILKRNEEHIQLAKTHDDIMQISESGKIAGLLGVEGGTALEDNLDNLHFFHDQGVRYLGLTWNDSPSWASCAKDEINPDWPGNRGLTDFGRRVIKTMNELGMIVDLSHSGEQTFRDVMELTTKPVIVSHSAVYEICPHFRNLKDDQLRDLADNGGIIGITFYPGYLVPGFDHIYQKARKEATAIQDSLKQTGSDEDFDRSAYIHRFIDPVYPGAGVIVDHIEYIIQLIGPEYVAIGSDYDGIPFAPAGLENVSKFSAITKELVARGHDRETIEKILGGNFLRVMKANESSP